MVVWSSWGVGSRSNSFGLKSTIIVFLSASCTGPDCKYSIGFMLAVLLPFKGGTNFTAKCNILSVNIRMLTGISMLMVEHIRLGTEISQACFLCLIRVDFGNDEQDSEKKGRKRRK